MMNPKKLCDELVKKPILTERPTVLIPRDVGSTTRFEQATSKQKPWYRRYLPQRGKSDARDAEANDTDVTVPLFTPPDSSVLTRHLREHLHKDETYLFHGTKLKNLKSIVENGFNHGKYARNGLYGKGIYLAESSEKADQYADPVNERRSDDLTLLVVRVLLGNVVSHASNEPIKAPYRGAVGRRAAGADSFVTALQKRFREFLVFDARQCYPEYIVLYDRVYEPSLVTT